MDDDPQATDSAESSPGRRAVVIVGALVLLGLSLYGIWAAISPARHPVRIGILSQAGYHLDFPDRVTVPTDDPNGGAAIALASNLPEGTKVLIQYHELPGENAGGGTSCCPDFESGHLDVTAFNGSCYLPPGAIGSTGFSVTVTVRPVFDNVAFEGLRPMSTPGQSPPGPPAQPDAVLAVLGQSFEHLVGDQVVSDGDVKELVATQDYDWPEGTCDPEHTAMVPETCPPKGEPISEDASADAVANSVVGALQQERLCELWGEATAEFQASHSWTDFRVEWRHWLAGLGSLAGPPGHEFEEGPIRSQVVETSDETFVAPSDGTVLPERLVADYFYNDRRIAQVEFVHVGSMDPGIVPQFQFDRFDIL